LETTSRWAIRRGGAGELVLPEPPTDIERGLYVKRHLKVLAAALIVASIGITYSLVRISLAIRWGEVLLVYSCYAALSFSVSLYSNYFTKDFDVDGHDAFVRSWHFNSYPSIDVWLPNCGESIDVLRNTWTRARNIEWPGVVNYFCLDDRGLEEVRTLADQFGFTYMSRPDKGWMKKSGNLKFAFEHSFGELVFLLDAGFCPRPDIFMELVPYLQSDEHLGIVQTSQYFRIHDSQNWIEKGAAQVQEYFYRACQWSRQQRGASICCGTNALYRRSALEENGGMTLVPQGEDMRTGFDLQLLGWKMLYLPLNLAAGLCPSDLSAFFKQQYRWCTGSLRLLTEKRFWTADLRPSQRLCYIAGFNYYLLTAMYTFVIPTLMLTMLTFYPERFRVTNYIVLLPAMFVMLFVYPLWHRCRYGPDAWSVKIICEWSYVFAILDFLMETVIPWDATGSGDASVASTARFRQFQLSSVLWNGVSSILWVGLGIWRVATGDWVSFLFAVVMGCFYVTNSYRLVESFFTRELVA
jgi:cellulose synthase/poly-beta-1,6-N-acetylglucosamine synthase-like glycosyltransferase